MKRQLFILDRQMLVAMTPEEVKATWKDMIEMKINKAPFEEFTVQIPFGMVASHLGEDLKFSETNDNRPFRIEYFLKSIDNAEALVNCTFSIEYNGKFRDFVANLEMNQKDDKAKEITLVLIQSTASYILTYLIVALATKNVERTTVKNSLAKFGIGKKKRGADYDYVTTLSIGKLIEYEGPSTYTGETRRPHLRRGHIRRQKYGPSLTYERKIWIEPIFVNGYSPEQDHRKAYNVKAH